MSLPNCINRKKQNTGKNKPGKMWRTPAHLRQAAAGCKQTRSEFPLRTKTGAVQKVDFPVKHAKSKGSGRFPRASRRASSGLQPCGVSSAGFPAGVSRRPCFLLVSNSVPGLFGQPRFFTWIPLHRATRHTNHHQYRLLTLLEREDR